GAGGSAAGGGGGGLLVPAPPGLGCGGAAAGARLHLEAGQEACFALAHGQAGEPPLAVWDAAAITARLDDTLAGWRSWSAIHQSYEGPWRDPGPPSRPGLPAPTVPPTGPLRAPPPPPPPPTGARRPHWG